MKTKILIIMVLLSSTCLFSQSKFSMGFASSQQFLQQDTGINFEGFVGYNIKTDISINLVASKANMKNEDLDIDYSMDKYAVVLNYDFGVSEKSKLESIFGFSYLFLDEKIVEEDNKGLGIDLGVQTTFGLKNKLNYGFKLVSTYNRIAPGGILNAGLVFKYNF